MQKLRCSKKKHFKWILEIEILKQNIQNEMPFKNSKNPLNYTYIYIKKGYHK